MKKLFLLGVFGLFLLEADAQIITNGDFESWSTVTNIGLSGYETSNLESSSYGFGDNVIQEPFARTGNFALSMTTVGNVMDTVMGYVINGDFDANSGGVAYTQRPDSLVGYFQCSVLPGDTAWIAAIFRSGSLPLGQVFGAFTGSVTSWTRFSFPVTWNVPVVTPDSMLFAAVSSNAINEIGIAIGSNLILDDVSFVGPGITQNTNNPGFEVWDTTNFYKPDNWYSVGDNGGLLSVGMIQRTTAPADVYEGLYSVRLETYGDGDDTIFGVLAKQPLFDMQGPSGFAFNRDVDTLIGYYKYSPSGADTGIAYVNMISGSVEYPHFYWFTAANTWTYFELPLNSPTPVDSIELLFASSNGDETSWMPGSVLYLDALDFKNCDIPEQPGPISGLGILCENDSTLNYTVGSVAGATSYDWTVPSGWTILSGQGTTSITAVSGSGSSSGFVTVAAAVYCGAGPDTTFLVNWHAYPAKPTISLVGTDSLTSSVTGSGGYEWYHEGTLLTATSKTIFGAQTGNYRVIAKNANCASDTSDEFFFVVPGMFEQPTPGLEIYPNPARENITVTYEGDLRELRLMDSKGSTILRSEVNASEADLDVTKVTPGVYLLKLVTESGTISRRISVE